MSVKLTYIKLLLLIFINGIASEKVSYYLLDKNAPAHEYEQAKSVFDILHAARMKELTAADGVVGNKPEALSINECIQKGGLKKVIDFFNENGWIEREQGDLIDPIESVFIALEGVKTVSPGPMAAYRKAESEMLMAFVLYTMPNSCFISKKHLQKAYAHYRNVFNMMKSCKKNPEFTEQILEEHKRLIKTELTEKLSAMHLDNFINLIILYSL